MAMILQANWTRIGRFRDSARRRFLDVGVILDQLSILINGDEGILHLLPVLKLRGPERDVISLPLTRRLADILGRRSLRINRATRAVGVRIVVIAVEHLELISILLINPAVAAVLPMLVGLGHRL